MAVYRMSKITLKNYSLHTFINTFRLLLINYKFLQLEDFLRVKDMQTAQILNFGGLEMSTNTLAVLARHGKAVD